MCSQALHCFLFKIFFQSRVMHIGAQFHKSSWFPFFFSQNFSLLWRCHVCFLSISICTTCRRFFLTFNTKGKAVPATKIVPRSLLPLRLLSKALRGLPYLQRITGSAQDQISFVYVILWLPHYICAHAVLPLVFRLEVCATAGANSSEGKFQH